MGRAQFLKGEDVVDDIRPGHVIASTANLNVKEEVVQVARYDNLLPAQKLGDEPNVMESHCD
jgi:hypothetical protein